MATTVRDLVKRQGRDIIQTDTAVINFRKFLVVRCLTLLIVTGRSTLDEVTSEHSGIASAGSQVMKLRSSRIGSYGRRSAGFKPEFHDLSNTSSAIRVSFCYKPARFRRVVIIVDARFNTVAG